MTFSAIRHNHCVRLNVRKRKIVLKQFLEQPTRCHDGFSINYGKTSHHDLRSCNAWLNRDFDVVLPLIVLRTHFGHSRQFMSTPCRSTLADVRFGRVFTNRTRRISPTETQTLTARRTLTTSETVVRYGARVHFD
jgi:hypothetical protein